MSNDWSNTALRQAEFLNKLSALMNEYQAQFTTEVRNHGYYHETVHIGIDACGTWIPYHDIGCTFTVDDCIAATAATIQHSKDVGQTAPRQAAG